MSDKKQYCGIGKKIEYSNGGHKIKCTSFLDDVKLMLKIAEAEGAVNYDVCGRKEPSEKGYTHYLVINDWKPEQQPPADLPPVEEKQGERQCTGAEVVEDDDNLPF